MLIQRNAVLLFGYSRGFVSGLNFGFGGVSIILPRWKEFDMVKKKNREDPMYVMDRFLVHNQTVHVCKTCERTEALNGYVLYPGSYFWFDPEEYPEESYAPEMPPRDDVPPPEVEL